MQSFIRWAGSKKQLLPVLKRYWSQKFTRYIEPFAGSSCFFFHIVPEQAILGDINSELILTMRTLRRDPTRILEVLRRMPRNRSAYYDFRSLNPSSLTDVEAAARFLYLNSLCFNGLYRTNKHGEFNVPYCPPGHKTFKEEVLMQASQCLQKAQILKADFQDTTMRAKPGDFVYLDPPFALSQRRVFSEYSPGSFGLSDLERLSTVLDDLDHRGASFLVSYADCREGRNVLKKWNPRRVWTRRNIAGFTGDRRGSFELIASNIQEMATA